jgi:4-aminobutyrate aminotransferase/(S)-3-amino-2-methylpropionate transaminase
VKNSKFRIAGMVIEPIQGEAGNYFCSPYYYQNLAQICKENDIALMVDEVNSGVAASGKMWAHQHWGNVTPDIVTFAKKM